MTIPLISATKMYDDDDDDDSGILTPIYASCRDNQNTHFMVNNFFAKIMPLMKKNGKMWYSGICNR
jgi:hypothetical protein